MCNVRISQDAKDKLEIISRQKSCSQGSIASNIIMHYAVNNLDYEVSFSDVQKAILQKLQSQSIYITKIAGSAERTESFIKALIHDERSRISSVPKVLSESAENGIITEPGQGHSLADALSIIRQLIESASPSSSFDGKAVMQIKIPMLEFNKLKSDHDRLCTSQNM